MENLVEMKLRLPEPLKKRIEAAAKRLSIPAASVVRLALTQWLESQTQQGK
jgi:predicted DNA-binding protein